MRGLYRGFCRNENGTETIVLNGEKIKGDWIYGGLYVNSRIYDIKATHLIMEVVDGFGMIEPPMAKPYEVIPETVCEAVRETTDINGKQIFEGDIIRENYYFCNSTRKVKYNYDHSGFGAYSHGCEQRQMSKEEAEHYEVIGTIFDEQFAEGV